MRHNTNACPATQSGLTHVVEDLYWWAADFMSYSRDAKNLIYP